MTSSKKPTEVLDTVRMQHAQAIEFGGPCRSRTYDQEIKSLPADIPTPCAASDFQQTCLSSAEITSREIDFPASRLRQADLTPAQQRVLDFIQSFQLAKGMPPTRAEIADHFGWSSANAAHEFLRALERKGRVRLIRGQSRGIRVLNETETLSLPQRTPIQRQAIQVRNIWDQEGCHSAQLPEALTKLLDMLR